MFNPQHIIPTVTKNPKQDSFSPSYFHHTHPNIQEIPLLIMITSKSNVLVDRLKIVLSWKTGFTQETSQNFHLRYLQRLLLWLGLLDPLS